MYWTALAGPREGADSYIHMEQTIESVTLYRFYSPAGFQHLWTTDFNGRNVLVLK